MSESKSDVRSIFCEALELSSPEAVEEYLDEACAGNSDLRLKVQELISVHCDAGNFLAGKAEQPTESEVFKEAPGTVIGPYKLREKIGEGGFGVVYVAEQQQPVSRKVALKIIKPGMDSKDIIARFEAERQALAMMDHPNVATVLDAGATESGRPYFVMGLVRGTSITDFCDVQKLTNQQRLELFVDVCRAVQHAHQKGIIHRDLKPSNIMITMADHQPVAKVIDFGVAKALHHKLTDKSVYTGYGQMVGTPMYMSPEQAQMSSLDVDTRSDIYSLGVLLYELLTGTAPFDNETFKQAEFDEIRRIIREDDPPRPSDRISTLNAELQSTISDQRKVDRRSLSQSLRGDLDWIVMKALEKDRSRRYETANALAADVQRFLDDEPVLACPPSTLYRFRKFTRRNKVALAFAAVIVVSLLAGIIGLTISNQMIAQREQAKQNALQTAEDNFRRAQSTVDEYLTRVSEEVLLNAPSMQPLRKDLLELALSYYQDFVKQQKDNSDLQEYLSNAYFRVGAITNEIGTTDESITAHQQAMEIREQLVSNDPQNAPMRFRLAMSRRELAVLLLRKDDNDQAEQLLTRAIEDLRRITAKSPENDDAVFLLAKSFRLIADLHSKRENSSLAKDYYRQAIDLVKKLVSRTPDDLAAMNELGTAYNNFGILQMNLGELQTPLELFEKAIEARQYIVEKNPTDLDARYSLAGGYHNRALVANALGRSEEALDEIRMAVEIQKDLVDQNPSVVKYQDYLIRHYFVLAKRLRAIAGGKEEISVLKQAVAIAKTRNEIDPTPTTKFQLARTLHALGVAGNKQQDVETQKTAFLEALDHARELNAAHPNVTRYQSVVCAILNGLVVMHYDCGDIAEAETLVREALTISDGLIKAAPRSPEYQGLYFRVRRNLTSLLSEQQRISEAIDVARETVAKLHELVGPTHDWTLEIENTLAELAND